MDTQQRRPGLSRRDLLRASGAAAAVAAAGGVTMGAPARAANDAGAVALVSGGTARAVIVRTADADATHVHTAENLQRWIEEATGVQLPIATYEEYQADPAGWPDNLLAVGFVPDEAAPGTADLIDGFDEDGFAIAAAGGTVTVVGPTSWGTYFGANHFLERHVGIKWLMPGDGPEGTHIPELSSLVVPQGDFTSEPAFLTRTLAKTKLSNPDRHLPPWEDSDHELIKWTNWAVRNGTRSRIALSAHNMTDVFRPRLYADPDAETYRPDFYPIVNGELLLPEPGAHQWQPRFSNPDTIPVTVDWVIRELDRPIQPKFVRLGVNDSLNFSETDYAPDGRLNANWLPDVSDVYFDWLNKVMEGVLAKRPDLSDRTLVTYAYHNTVEAPSFPLHPNIAVFITRDFYGWAGDEWREREKRILQKWGEVTDNHALFAYNYGRAYNVPRLYEYARSEMLRHAHSTGSRHIYEDGVRNELGEGPKMWVHLKQMWDPSLDTDELINEWCIAAVGEAAAGALKAAFAVWDDVWSTKVSQSPWFDWSTGRDFFEFRDGSYVEEILPEDAHRVRQRLERARNKTVTDAQRLRADLMLRKFEFHEAIVDSYPHQAAKPADAADAIALVNRERDELDGRVADVTRALTLLDELEADPLTATAPAGNNPFALRLWTGYDGYGFWHLVDYLALERAGHVEVRRRLEVLAGRGDLPMASRYARFLLNTADGNLPNLAANPSFERRLAEPSPGMPEDQIWEMTLPEPVGRPDGVGRDGGRAVRISRKRGQSGVHQRTIPAAPGLWAARVYVRSAAAEIKHGTAGIFLSASETGGSSRADFHRGLKFIRPGGGWSWVATMEDIPAEVKGGAPLGVVHAYIQARTYEADGPVYFDDVTIVSDADLT